MLTCFPNSRTIAFFFFFFKSFISNLSQSMMKQSWLFYPLKGKQEAAMSSRHIFNHKQIIFLPQLSLFLWGNHQVGSVEKYCFLSGLLALLFLLSLYTCGLFIPSWNTATQYHSITSAVIKVLSLLNHPSSESISLHLSLPPCVFSSSSFGHNYHHPFRPPLYLITVSQQTTSRSRIDQANRGR